MTVALPTLFEQVHPNSWLRPQEPARMMRAVLGLGAGIALTLDATRRMLLPGQGAEPIVGVPEMMAGAQLLTHMPPQVTAAWRGTWYHPNEPALAALRQRIGLLSSAINYIGLARQGLQELSLHGPSSWAFLAAAQGLPSAVALAIEVGRPSFLVFDDRYFAWSAHRVTAALLPTALLLTYDAWAAWPTSTLNAAANLGAAIGAGVFACHTRQLAKYRLPDWHSDVRVADLGTAGIAFGSAIAVWGLRRLQRL